MGIYISILEKRIFQKSNFMGFPSVVKNTKIKVSSIKDGTKKFKFIFKKQINM